MRILERRLDSLHKIISECSSFSRLKTIKGLSKEVKTILLQNIGVYRRVHDGETNQHIIDAIERIPSSEWENRLAEAQAKDFVNNISALGGHEAQRKFLEITEDFESGKIDKIEFQKQLELFDNQLNEHKEMNGDK